ncbi:MAG TPA: hypothetical protein PLA94_25345 [Myxococcota bacterium]|nr:hypothetical protein [Myxococcota bacterium]
MSSSAKGLLFINGLLCLLITGSAPTAAVAPACVELSGRVEQRGEPEGGGPGLLLDYGGRSLILLAPATWDVHKELLRLEVQKAAAEAARVGVFEAPADIAAWGGVGLVGGEHWSEAGDQGIHCCAQSGRVACTPRAPGPGSPPPPARTPDRSWLKHPWAGRFTTVFSYPVVGGFVALHPYPSDIDGEMNGLRPYVFAMEDGWYTERWRGSGLSRPLVGLRPEGDALCATLRKDSFLAPNPEEQGREQRRYIWKGLGFREEGSCSNQ